MSPLCSPISRSRRSKCLWFVQDAVLTDELRAYLAENRIETRPYESFYDYAAAIPAGETVLLDKGVCNYRLVSELCEGVEIVDDEPLRAYEVHQE